MVIEEAKRAVAEADAIVDVVVVRVGLDERKQPTAVLKVINRLKGPAVDRFIVSEPGGACELPIRYVGKFGRVLLKRYVSHEKRSVWFVPSYFNIGGEPFSDSFNKAIDATLNNRRSHRFADTLWN